MQTDESDGDSGSGDNVIDLMAALKQSLAKAEGKSSSGKSRKSTAKSSKTAAKKKSA